MSKPSKSTLPLVAAAGVGSALVWKLTDEKTNQGGIPIVEGLPAWDETGLENDPGVFVGLDGKRYQVGSYGAANAAYEVAAECSRVLTRYTQLVDRALVLDTARAQRIYAGFTTNGRYSVAGNTTHYEQILISQMVRAALSFGYALRLLAQTYESARLGIDYRPALWVRRGLDLRRIGFGSLWNPQADHAEDGSGLASDFRMWTIARHEQWAVVGVLIINAWSAAYLNLGQVENYQAYLDEIEDDLKPPPGVMGVLWAPLVWTAGKAIALILGTYLGYRVIMAVGSALSQWLGHNVKWLDAMEEAHERALDCAYDGSKTPEERQACMDEAARIQSEIRSYQPPMSGVLRWAAIAGIGLGGYWALKRLRRT